MPNLSVTVLAYRIKEYAGARQLTIGWMDFVEAVPRLLWASGADTLFALGGGLIGAYYAAREAAKPKLGVQVEKTAG